MLAKANGSVSSSLSTPVNPQAGSKLRALCMVMFFACATLLNCFALAFIHDYVPNGKPLPDAWFHFVPENATMLIVTEVCLLLNILIGFVTMAIHPSRWLVFSRVFFITGTLYIGRALCLMVTLLPLPTMSHGCSPKSDNPNWYLIFKRTVNMAFTFGLQAQEFSKLCGDLIYSGHTVAAVMADLAVKEYAPRKLMWLPTISRLLAIVTIFGILTSRIHYTIDVVLGYYFASRTFWWYHSAANNHNHYGYLPVTTNSNGAPDTEKRGDWLSKIFWYPFVSFIEGYPNGNGSGNMSPC